MVQSAQHAKTLIFVSNAITCIVFQPWPGKNGSSTEYDAKTPKISTGNAIK
jgi:hypothetical protein